jgi:hypothetical protein
VSRSVRRRIILPGLLCLAGSLLPGGMLLFGTIGLTSRAAGMGMDSPPERSVPATTPDTTTALAGIRRDVKAICDSLSVLLGYDLEEPVAVRYQSPEEFRAYVQRQLAVQMPDSERPDYVALMHLLGLLPEKTDLAALMMGLYESQAAAYYDPDTRTFYLLMTDMNEASLGMIGAHELTHAFQDQRYDMRSFLTGPAVTESLSTDAALARQFLVEGQATWAMTAYVMRQQGMRIDTATLGLLFQMQNKMSYDQLVEQFAGGAALIGGDLAAAVAQLKDIPRVLMEPMLTAYLGGAAFVNEAMMTGGLARLDSLFARPPRSTEQVLHPDRCLQHRDRPRAFAVAGGASVASLDPGPHCEIRLTDTLGELMIRVYFESCGRVEQAASWAGGWDGDRIALVACSNEQPLLLWWTVWDDETEAQEFALGFRQSLRDRFPDLKARGELLLLSDGSHGWLVQENGDRVCVAGNIRRNDLDHWRTLMQSVVPVDLPR